MCTCINIIGSSGFFGRTLDLDYSFNEKVIITPRNYKIDFKCEKSISNHYAIVGIGTIVENFPLYAEASNEHGLSIAYLNFNGLARYNEIKKDRLNLAVYEVGLFLLSKYKNVDQIKNEIEKINIINIPYNDKTSLTDLHIMIADNKESVVIEQTLSGLKVYKNRYNVLTNNPEFSFHENNLSRYIGLSNLPPTNNIDKCIDFNIYSLGLGAIGLPGDYSSTSRFVRAFFNKSNTIFENDEEKNVYTFFKLLDSVSIIKGLVKVEDSYHYTIYSSCFSYQSKMFYYKTYNSNKIYKIDMLNKDLTQKTLIEMKLNENIEFIEQNS